MIYAAKHPLLHRMIARAAALDLMQRCGMPYTTGVYSWASKPPWLWDGKTCYVDALTDEHDASNLFHELAHWIVATPEERAMPDFGLGPSPESAYRGAYTFTDRSPKDVEAMASVLGIELQWHYGFAWDETVTLHSWFDSADFCAWMPRPLETAIPYEVRQHVPFRRGFVEAVEGLLGMRD